LTRTTAGKILGIEGTDPDRVLEARTLR
jgi:hypothetical protein